MIKKTLLVVFTLVVVLVAVGSIMYGRNATPTVPAISSAEAGSPNKPYVVKLVLDGRTKDATASIHGIRGFDEYRAAIDASLREMTR